MALGWDISAVQTALITWASSAAGVTFVMAGQQGAPPALPYGTLQILSGPVSGNVVREEHVYNSGPDEVEFRGRNEGVMTVRFQAFSQTQAANTSARAYLEHLAGSLALISTKETLTAAGLAAHASPPVSDISGVVSNETVGRATMDVSFNLNTQVTETISYITQIDGTGTTTLPDGSDVTTPL